MPISINLDLRKLGRIPGMKTLGKAMNAAGTAMDKVDSTLDAAGSPIKTSRVRACTLERDAELTGMADRPRLARETGAGYEVLLLRLRVARPDGPADCCVRQSVPSDHKRTLAPGARLRVLAHESNPGIAIVKWDESFKPIGDAPQPMAEVVQYDWPDREDWPAEGAVEVRDDGRYRRRLEERRATWSTAGARLLRADARGSQTNDRADWRFELQLSDGRIVTVDERTPHLVLLRLFPGAPIAVLVSPAGDVAVDWEATLRYPEMRRPEA
jgi:hypothetical protein